MKIEIEMEGQGKDKPDMEAYIAHEQSEHPWMDRETAERVVYEHLKINPKYYEMEDGESEQDEAEEGNEPMKDDMSESSDPFEDYK